MSLFPSNPLPPANPLRPAKPIPRMADRIVAMPPTEVALDRWRKLGCRLQDRLQRELAAQGDSVDRELLKLQHDLTDLLSDTGF